MVWMVFIKGMGKPKKHHATLEIAHNEAVRLSAKFPTRDIYVLDLVEVIKATHREIGLVPINGVAETPVVAEIPKEEVKLAEVVKLPIITIKKVRRIVKP